MQDIFLSLGGGNEIGASCYFFRLGKNTILVDAGMRFHSERALPAFEVLNELTGGLATIDALLLTHAHLDHCGAITRVHYDAPFLVKYATQPTLDLADVMLHDALRVSAKRQAEDWSITETSRDLLDAALASFVPIRHRETFDLGNKGAKATGVAAGHILGATSFLIEAGGRRILHTGDISLHAQRTIGGMHVDAIPDDIDVMVIESTYAHQPHYGQEAVEEQYFALAESVSRVVAQDGHVLIPAFAVGRAQEIAVLLSDFFEQGLIAPFPVYLDGLIRPVCEVFNNHRDFLAARLQTKHGHVFYDNWVRPVANRSQHRRPQPLEPGCMIASSGMLLDGTRSAYYALEFLPRTQDAVFFSGYLDDESPGYRLLSLQNGTAQLKINGRTAPVRAQVAGYRLSAHAPAKDLKRLIRLVHPKMVILVHGDNRYASDSDFTEFLMQLEAEGIAVQQAINGIPIYL